MEISRKTITVFEEEPRPKLRQWQYMHREESTAFRFRTEGSWDPWE